MASSGGGEALTWLPQEEGLREICGLLKHQMAPSSDERAQIYQKLQQYSQFPDFDNYLAFIFARVEGKSVEIRQATGLLLKNNLRDALEAMSPTNQQYLKSELLPCMGSADRQIRSTAGTIISTFVQIGGVAGWPELLDALVKCLDSNDVNRMEGAMDALSKICEDAPQVLDSDIPGLSERPIDVFLPRFLQLFQSPNITLRKLSLGSVNQYIMLMPKMSLAANSPVHSSSSDDFAALLDSELDTISDASTEIQEVAEEEENIDDDEEGDYDLKFDRVKRRKVESYEFLVDVPSSSSQGSSPKKDKCMHPGAYAGMCTKCGVKMDNEFGVAFGYIHKNLRLANDEISRLREKDLKKLLHHKKLYLVLDLDHTLLNSTRLVDVTVGEGYLNDQRDALPDTLKRNLCRLESMQMMTKLRPFVHTFLKHASDMFEMYIYTMGERPYALEMAKLLDPGDVYFNSRIIAQGDCTRRHQKGLDIVLGQESAVLILDDTEAVWKRHKENLILMERYNYFASSSKHFGFNCKSLSELRSDESESDGALATVLRVLQQIHSLFFDPGRDDNLVDRDARQILKRVREEVLAGCKVVFSRVFPTNFQAEQHHLWKMAMQLGATCSMELDSSVTHVVSMDAGTHKSRWAVQEKKFLVHPLWIEASNYLWKKQPEENFPVSQSKNK